MTKNVLVIIILAAVLVVSWHLYSDHKANASRSRITTAARSMSAERDAIRRYEAAEGKEISSWDDLVPEYLSEVPRDPWGNKFILLAEERGLLSAGPDYKYSFENPEDQVNRDNFFLSYDLPLRIDSAYFDDRVVKNGLLDSGEIITIFFTRKLSSPEFTDKHGKDFKFAFQSWEQASFIPCNDPDASGTSELGLLEALPAEDGALPGEFNGEIDCVRFRVRRKQGCPFPAEFYVRMSDPAVMKYSSGDAKCISPNFNVKVEKLRD